MRARLALILLIVYSTSFSELPQLFKIPVLIEHYSEHQLREPGISFWAFIKEHYQGKFDENNDYHRDSQLPFRATDASFISIVCGELPVPMELPVTINIDKPAYKLINDNNNPVGSPQDIFQPPRASHS